MRCSISRVATTIVVGLLLSACASATSPAPVTPPTAPTSPASSAPATTAPPASPPPTVSPAIGRIAAGYQYTCALTSGGGVKCWGGSNGSVPIDVPGLSSGVSAIAAGDSHTCALTGGGGVKCWGPNDVGQLGNGTTTASRVPVDVAGLASGVSAIAAGWGHTCALTSAGGVKCWGYNAFGQLGNGTNTDSSVPVDVAGLASGVSAIAAGGRHTCALASGGGVTCWGDGQSDDANLFHSNVPVDVPGLANGITAITAGNDKTCALTNGGGVTCWGPNYAPPPGESLPDRMVPLDVSGLASGVAAIALGDSNICALTNSGGVACWGNNSYGQLGNGTTTDRRVSVPGNVSGLASGVTAIAVGGMHTCALTGGGGVKCWGSNGYGQLGNVMRCISSSVPVDVPLDSDLAAPSSSSEPTRTPIGRIEHAMGPTDVVLRFDYGPDLGASELTGEYFQPGPEFTLYGDGTVIFRNDRAKPPPAEGPIIRARPFKIAHLDEAQIQSLLRFALGEGGLRNACERYETQDVDGVGGAVFTIHAGGLDKRVVVPGSSPFEALADHLRNFDRGGSIPTQVWVPDRYWGSLSEAGGAIENGVLPDPRDAGSAPWPWPDLEPGDFVGRDEGGWIGNPRRIMSADEAAVLGLSANGGVVKRIYLLGPDRKTIYSFSLWPVFPDETS